MWRPHPRDGQGGRLARQIAWAHGAAEPRFGGNICLCRDEQAVGPIAVSEVTKLGELYSDLAKEAFRPHTRALLRECRQQSNRIRYWPTMRAG